MNLFLIDESLSPKLELRLKELGYKVKIVRDFLKGFSDENIVKWAIKNGAVIITGDLDFGELWYWHYEGKLGVIVLRIKDYNLENQLKVINFLHENNLLTDERIKNSLIISTPSRYRIKSG